MTESQQLRYQRQRQRHRQLVRQPKRSQLLRTSYSSWIQHNNIIVLCMLSLLVVLKFIGKNGVAVHGFPMILSIDEDSERCFRFNIPEADDAHLVMVVLPGGDELPTVDDQDLVETWYVDQVYKLTRQKSKNKGIPDKNAFVDEQPGSIAMRMSDFLKNKAKNGLDTFTYLKITKESSEVEDPDFQYIFNAKYFEPHVVNFLHKVIRGKLWKWKHGATGKDSDAALEGYGICIENEDEERMVHVILDLVLVSEDIGIGEGTEPEEINALLEESVKQAQEAALASAKAALNKAETDFDKQKHLTPLERSLDQSISAANAVVREMKYMEKREARMRYTADSINTRVRWFSYLSVSVLLVVTYVQVTYLKRYFHKKKLM